MAVESRGVCYLRKKRFYSLVLKKLLYKTCVLFFRLLFFLGGFFFALSVFFFVCVSFNSFIFNVSSVQITTVRLVFQMEGDEEIEGELRDEEEQQDSPDDSQVSYQ